MCNSTKIEFFSHYFEQKVDVTSPNVVFDKQEVKDVEERETNGEITGYNSNPTLNVSWLGGYYV